MLAEGEQEKLNSGILRAAFEAVTLEDFGSEVLPLLGRLFDASTSLLYRANERRELIAIDGPLVEGHYVYAAHYYAIDPIQAWMKRHNPKMLHGAGFPGYQDYLKHPAHTECSTHYGFDNFIHLRLNECGMHEPGMVGMVLARTSRQPDFNEAERMSLVRLLPSLEALVRRSGRLGDRLQAQACLESILEAGPRPLLALDPRGGLHWASGQAAEWLGLDRRKEPPPPLVEAARHLGTLLEKKRDAAAAPANSLTLTRKDGVALRAELRLARNRDGAAFIVVELEAPGPSPALAQLAARHELTGAETQVLALLSLGLNDRQIARRLFVSLATVHTHVSHVLGKLGVASRVQAALLARGHAVEEEN